MEDDAIHGGVHQHGMICMRRQDVMDECVGGWQHVYRHAVDRLRWAGYMSE